MMVSKKTRLLSWLVTLTMLLSLAAYFTVSVIAADATEISSASQFISAVSANRGGNFKLVADLDFSEIDNEAPLFTYEAPFTGTLDGDGYIIKNYVYSGTDNYVGLFRFNAGTIKNLTLDESCSISGNAYVGAIAGQNNGTIQDCISRANVTMNSAVASPTQYTVMTQNLWSGGEKHYLETKKPTTYDPANGSPRFSGMLTRISSYSPDILALQEVTPAGESFTYTDADGASQTVTTANWNTYLWGDGATGGKLSETYTLAQSATHADGTTDGAVQLAYTDKFSVPSRLVNEVETPYSGVIDLNSGRKAVYAVLQPTGNTEEILLVYAYHTASATNTNDTADLRDSIESVYNELLLDDNLKEKRILVVAAGTSYGLSSIDSALDNHMDDSRQVAEKVNNDAGTVYVQGSTDEDTNTLTLDTSTAGCIATRDYIVVNTDAVEINSMDVVSSGYTVDDSYIHPSNHAAVYAEIEALSGSQIGGMIGRNSGTVERVMVDTAFSVANSGVQAGEVIGVMRGGSTVAIFSQNSSLAIGGRSTKISGVETLTAKPSLEVIWKMTEASASDEAARFRLIDEQYRILHEAELLDDATAYQGEYRIPARIGVNGVYYYDYVGGTFNLDVTGIPEPKYLVKDGVIVELESTEFEVTGDMNVAVATSIANVELASQLGVKYYTIGSADELVLAQKNLDKFNSLAVTIYLTADIDLAGRTDFDGFRDNVYFSFDGQGHTISNWSHDNAVGFFSGANGSNATASLGYRGYYIKNVSFDNLQLKDGYGRSVVVGMAAGENDFLMENVHVSNSITTSTGGGNLSGILYTHSNHDVSKNVTIRNCSAVNCTITSEAGDFTNSGVVSGRIGNGITWDISDIYISNFNDRANSKTDTSNGNGFLIGTIEGSTVTLNNIGIFDSKHTHPTDDSIQPMGYELIGRFINGTVNAKNIICAGNTASAFYSSAGYRTLNITREGSIYTDNAIAYQNLYSLTSGEAAPVIDGQSDYETMDGFGTKINGTDFTVGMAAYGVNTGLTDANSIYWKIDDSGKIVAGTAEEQVRKVTIYYPKDTDSNGTYDATEAEILYAIGGVLVSLDPTRVPQTDGVPDYSTAYVASSNGNINTENGTVTVGNDADTVVGFITENDGNAYKVVQLLNYYAKRELSYYADSNSDNEKLSDLIAAAKEKMADGTYINSSAAALEMANKLSAYQTNFYAGTDIARLPAATAENFGLYQNQPEGAETQASPLGYIIMNIDDLMAVKENEGLFTTAQTIYLGADLDLTGVDFVGFGATDLVAGSVAVEFNFDGLNHKLSNWGKGENLTKLSAGKFGGLFRYADTSIIKNLTIENADLTSTLDRTSLLFSSSTTGADNTIKLNDSREAQLIENVHIIGCKLTSTYESSLFMSNLQPYRASVTFENCSVKDSSISGTGNNHAAFVGRTSAGGGDPKTLTLRNCLVDNVAVDATLGSSSANSGILVGSFEDGCTAVVRNVGIFNSSVKSHGIYGNQQYGAGILGVQTNGSLTIDNVVAYNNTVEVVTESINSNCYLVAGNFNGTASNIYYDGTYGIDPNSEITTVTTIEDEQITGKEIAYLLNTGVKADDGYFYWEMPEEALAYCELARATRQLTVKNNLGAIMDTFYLGGGESVTLGYTENPDETYTIAPDGAATQSVVGGNTVITMGTDSDLAVTATATTDSFAAYSYPSVTTIETAEDIDAEILGYTIANATEWMHVFNKLSVFQQLPGTVTLHLKGDVDLSETVASTFTGFMDLQCGFDGHGFTVKNWKSATSPASAKGIFAVTYATNDNVPAGAGMSFIKNLNVENCHAFGIGSLVYGAHHNNCGNDNLPATFTMENVHVKNSSFKSNNEGSSILVTRHARYTGATTVTIKNCSVIGSTLDANGKAHSGLILGKARGGNGTGAAATYNISDIYIADSKIINAKDNTGLLYGCSESSSSTTTVNLTNIGVVNSSISQSSATSDVTKEAALAGSFNGGKATLTNVFFGGNELNADATYLFAGMAGQSASGRATATNVYYDNADLTGLVDTNTGVETQAGLTQKTEDSFTSGEVAYLMNTAIDGTNPSFYWKMNGSVTAPAYEQENATRRLTMMKDSITVKTRYLNGGAVVALSVSEDPEATFALSGSSNGNATMAADQITLTMATKTTWVVTVAINSDADFGAYASDSVLTVTDTSCSDGAAYDFTIANATEWMYVFNHSGPRVAGGVVNDPNYFSYPNVTLHLTGDIDLSEAVAEDFVGFVNTEFSLDGHGYTIKNWGTQADPILSRGIFAIIDAQDHYASNTAHPHYLGKAMNSLKNFNVENVHLNNMEKGCSIVCGFFAGASKCSAEIPATFTMENIHVRNSSMSGVNDSGDQEQGVLLATYYRPAATDETTVKIIDCSVEDVSLDCGENINAGNAGALIGKMYATNTDKRHTFVLADNYINNFTLTNASQRSGLLFGTLEYGASTADSELAMLHAYNNGIFNSSITTAAEEAALVGICNDASYTAGGSYGCYYYISSNLMEGNTVTNAQSSESGRYLLGSTNSTAGGGSFNDSNIVDDDTLACSYSATEQNGTAKGWDGTNAKYITFAPSVDSDYLNETDADQYLDPSDATRTVKQSYHRQDFAHGYAAYTNNQRGTTGYTYSVERVLYWTVDPSTGDTIPTENGNRTRKVTFTLKDGAADPAAADEMIGYGYTGSDKLVLADGIDDYTFSLYEWEKESTGAAYTRTTRILGSDATNGVAAVWAYAVFSDSLESAMEYWENKDITRYFADAETIQAHIDLMKERIAENYYQLQENAVAGLGFAALEKDTNLIKAYYAHYQEADATAGNVPNAADPEYQDAPHFIIANYADLKAVDDRSTKNQLERESGATAGSDGGYLQGTDIYLKCDLDLDSEDFYAVYGSGGNFDGFNAAVFNFIGIPQDGNNPVIRDWIYDAGPARVGLLRDPSGNIFKNVDFESVKLTGGTGCAILCASANTDYGGSGQLVFDNIHFDGCSITTNTGYEQTAYLMANMQAGRTGADISNCSFKNCTTVGNNNNNSVLIGRLVTRSMTVNVKNVLVENVEISSYGRSNTLLLGVMEGADSVYNIENVGVFKSKISSLGTGGVSDSGNASAVTYQLTANYSNGTINLKNILLSDNTQISKGNKPNAVVGSSATANGATLNMENCYIASNFAEGNEGSGSYLVVDIANYGSVSEMTVAGLETTYDANGDGEAESLTATDFKNGKAAWIANQAQIADSDPDGETWLVDQSFNAYPTLFAADGLNVPNQVILTNNTEKTGALDDYYTNSVDTLPSDAQDFMNTYSVIHEGGSALDWLDAENAENTAKYAATTYYGDADSYIADDNSITLEVQGVICVELTWGDMQFTYDYGTWDPHNLTYQGRGWNLHSEPGNSITLNNNGNVYTEVLLTYSAADANTYQGVVGAFDASDADTPDLAAESLVKMNAKTDGFARSFSFTGVPDWEWETNQIVIGTITAVINNQSA